MTKLNVASFEVIKLNCLVNREHGILCEMFKINVSKYDIFDN